MGRGGGGGNEGSWETLGDVVGDGPVDGGTRGERQCGQSLASFLTGSAQYGHARYPRPTRGSFVRLGTMARIIPAKSGLIRSASKNQPKPLRPLLGATAPITMARINHPKRISIPPPTLTERPNCNQKSYRAASTTVRAQEFKGASYRSRPTDADCLFAVVRTQRIAARMLRSCCLETPLARDTHCNYKEIICNMTRHNGG